MDRCWPLTSAHQAHSTSETQAARRTPISGHEYTTEAQQPRHVVVDRTNVTFLTHFAFLTWAQQRATAELGRMADARRLTKERRPCRRPRWLSPLPKTSGCAWPPLSIGRTTPSFRRIWMVS